MKDWRKIEESVVKLAYLQVVEKVAMKVDTKADMRVGLKVVNKVVELVECMAVEWAGL